MIWLDVSKGIDVNKTDGLREKIIYHYWYFLDIIVRFDPKVCNGCHDLMQKVMSFNDITIVLLKETIIKFIFGIWVKMKPLFY